MRKKVIIFDMDGTILDSESLCLECWDKIDKKYGLGHVREAAMRCIGVNAESAKKIFREQYGEDFPYEQYRKEVRKLFCQFVQEKGMPIKAGSREILEYLKKENWKLVIASSTNTKIVMEELEQEGLLLYFDEILGGDMVSRSKPYRDLFLKACGVMGCKPEEAYVIEDSFNGVRAAYSAGIEVIMVPDQVEPDEEMKKKSFLILDSLIEVKKFLENSEENLNQKGKPVPSGTGRF